MATLNEYDKGDLIRLTVAFTVADVATDPTTVGVKYKKPSGGVTTKTFPVDPEIVKDSVGNYHIDVPADETGVWSFRWESTGTAQGAEEGQFKVRRSHFD